MTPRMLIVRRSENMRTGLLPPGLETARLSVPVAHPLTVKGHPWRTPKARPRELVESGLIWRRTAVLAHVGAGPDESYMLIDKQHPHAQHELMLMSAGTELRAGLQDHSASFTAALGAVTACFAACCHDAGLYPVLSWSYDPATHDRESIQGEKRFHAHLVGRTQHEVALVERLARPASEYPAGLRRRVLDEAGVLAALLVGDCLGEVQLCAVELVAPLSTPQATAGLQFRVPGGWAAFAGGALTSDLRAIHRVLRHVYDAIARACLAGQSGLWKRPILDAGQAGHVALPLSACSQETLSHYLSGLRPDILADTRSLADPRNRDLTTHVYPLADLAYSVCFSEHQGQLFAYLRVNVFSDLGGAGVSMVNGTIVKVRKGVGIYDQKELAARTAFQRGFLTTLRQHPEHGAAALFPALVSC
jgi:hypothetical protein